MKNKTLITTTICLLLLGALPLKGQSSFILKNDVFVAEDETQNNVVTFGGDIYIKGKVNESAIAFGGTITIEGEVGDVVLGFGSEIILKSTAVIEGDVASLGGTLTREPGAVIEGDTIYFKTSEDLKELLREGIWGRVGFSLIPLLIIIKLVTAFIWFILAVLLVSIFPRQIALGADQIRSSFWPILATGLISIIIFIGLIIFSAFLSLILIGIPILLALIIIGIIIKIFGQVILFYFFGESLHKAFSQKKSSPLLAITLGFVMITVIGLIPIFGALFSLVLSLIGWGAVIRTKFGTIPNWFSRGSV
jgi:hypothetical protein